MEKVYLEDYSVGEKIISPARTITETDIVMFAALTGDWHPLHTNVEYAKEGPFGERIAHGMLTLCIGSALIFRLGMYVALPKSFIAFYGMDSVRFVGVVKIGDTIHCEVEVVALDIKDEKRGVIVSKNSIKNQRGEDAVVYTTRALVGRRSQS
ncbi:MAG: MaoC/PaaZ C-terminal domain-containing protein [Thermodesulfobacteriota bacterium]|nr:MaoC/PaaZ C-terminal domain-containing protein [Thermodesulfobacteriota bacterium]